MKSFIMCLCLFSILMSGCKKKAHSPHLDKMMKEAEKAGVPIDRETAEKLIKMADTNSLQAQLDLSPFLELVELRQFNKAHDYLDETLKSIWPKEIFSGDLRSFREEIGEKWNAEQLGFMNNFFPEYGPTCNVTYQLTTEWRNPFSMQIIAHKTEQDFEIIQLYIAGPSSNKEAFNASKKIGFQLLAAIEKLDVGAVKELMLPSLSQQVSEQVLKQINDILYQGRDTQILFNDHFQMGFLNGKKVFQIVAYPKGHEMTQLEIKLSEEPAIGMRVAGFYFKGKI